MFIGVRSDTERAPAPEGTAKGVLAAGPSGPYTGILPAGSGDRVQRSGGVCLFTWPCAGIRFLYCRLRAKVKKLEKLVTYMKSSRYEIS